MKNNTKRIKSIVCIILIACYAIGMLCMFIDAFAFGVALWAVSLVGGLAVLYGVRNEERKAAERERLEKAAKGGDDEPCE